MKVMSSDTRVTVIIPAFNCASYIAQAAKSVLSQGYDNLELILVDDGSDDDTNKVAEELMSDPRVRYLKHGVRKGLSAARNTGIKAATGQYIALLDADDIFTPGKLKLQADRMNRSRAKISYTNEVYFCGEKEISSPRAHFSGDVFFFLKRSNFIHVSTVMAKAEVLRENMFDETLKSHEDWDCFLRIAYKGHRFLYLDNILSRIMVRPGNMTGNNAVMEVSRSEVGHRAKAYWKEMKRKMNLFTLSGLKAIIRYVTLRVRALLLGFPEKGCYNMPTPQQVLMKI